MMSMGGSAPCLRGACRALALALLTGAFAVSGCAAKDPAEIPPGTPEPDRYLFERATALLADGDWQPARVLFTRVVDGYPQSPYRFDARLGLGDSFLEQGGARALVQGVNQYTEFLRFYPTHARADYAQLQIATAYFEAMLSPDRDQTQTRAAVEAFELFFELYPESEMTDLARERYRQSRDRLSEAHMRVGEFYFDQRWYPGAIERLRSLLSEDPAFNGRDGVYFMLAESLVALDRAAEALPYFERLVEEFEQSEYLQAARVRIAELKGQGT